MTLQNIILKQLAFENANEACRSVLRPIRETGSLMEYLKAYRDIRSMSHRAKLAALETFNVQKAANAKCFNCGKPSHMKKQCRLPTQARKIILLLIGRDSQEYVQDVKGGFIG